jgi:hypothetical protein
MAPIRAVATPLVLDLARDLDKRVLKKVAKQAREMCTPLLADVGMQLLQKGEQLQGSAGEVGCRSDTG